MSPVALRVARARPSPINIKQNLRRSATEAQPGLDLEGELRASIIEFDHSCWCVLLPLLLLLLVTLLLLEFVPVLLLMLLMLVLLVL